MKNKFLIVVDMQNDFISGSLGTPEAQSIVPNVVEKIRTFDGTVVFTQDTHYEDYLTTQEGRNLPVIHCSNGSVGWQLESTVKMEQLKNNAKIFIKSTFASKELGHYLLNHHQSKPIDSIELIGLCTDICVVSNALLTKALIAEVQLIVTEACCAGVTPASHLSALNTLKMCQIEVK